MVKENQLILFCVGGRGEEMVPRAERPIPRHITCNDSDQNHLNFHIIRTRDARDYNIYDRDSMEVYHNYSP